MNNIGQQLVNDWTVKTICCISRGLGNAEPVRIEGTYVPTEEERHAAWAVIQLFEALSHSKAWTAGLGPNEVECSVEGVATCVGQILERKRLFTAQASDGRILRVFDPAHVVWVCDEIGERPSCIRELASLISEGVKEMCTA